jgi:hypothetical protein
MTDIDPRADIEINHGEEHVTARIPLAGQVTNDWLRYYQKLARARDLPAEAVELPGRAWIVVRVPASDDHDEVLAMLDTARSLIAEVDAAAEQPPSANGGAASEPDRRCGGEPGASKKDGPRAGDAARPRIRNGPGASISGKGAASST